MSVKSKINGKHQYYFNDGNTEKLMGFLIAVKFVRYFKWPLIYALMTIKYEIGECFNYCEPEEINGILSRF